MIIDRPNHVVICPCCGAERSGVDFLVDPETNTIATVLGQVRLTPKQFVFARLLIERSPGMVTKEYAYEAVFLDDTGNGPEIKIVDVVLCKIRKALLSLGLEVRTEWGKGYRVVWLGPEGPQDPAEVMRAPRGPQVRWSAAHDDSLRDLMGRGFKPSQIAAIMKKPYGAIERAMRRLGAEVV